MENTNTKLMETRTKKLVNCLSNSGGRFIGLSTKNEILNARFVRQTPRYVIVFDRNNKKYRKFAKSSLLKVKDSGKVVCL